MFEIKSLSTWSQTAYISLYNPKIVQEFYHIIWCMLTYRYKFQVEENKYNSDEKSKNRYFYFAFLAFCCFKCLSVFIIKQHKNFKIYSRCFSLNYFSNLFRFFEIEVYKFAKLTRKHHLRRCSNSVLMKILLKYAKFQFR